MRRAPGAPGQVKEVTSLANPIVKDIKALALKKFRDQQNAFLAEGLKLVIDALDLGWSIRTLVFAKSGLGNPAVEKVAARTVAAGGLVLEVNEKVLSAITRRDNPQMVVGVFAQKYLPLRDVRPSGDDVWVALDRVRDPGNLGTVIRTIDAVGAKGLILVGDTTDPFSVETVRATMGSVFAVPVARATTQEFLAWRKKFSGARRRHASQGRGRLSLGRLCRQAGSPADGQRAARAAGRARRRLRSPAAHSAGRPRRFAQPCGRHRRHAVRDPPRRVEAGARGRRVKLRSLLSYAAVTALAVAADQWVKHLVETHLPMQEKIDVLPFLALFRTYNTGVAFSMFASIGDLGLIAISAAVILFVLYLAARTSPDQIIARTGFALIIGGAIGNIIDRALLGHVIDYVLFHTPVWSFAVFNLADALITVGAVLVIIEELLVWRKARRGGAPSGD